MYLLTVRFRSPARRNRPALEDANRGLSIQRRAPLAPPVIPGPPISEAPEIGSWWVPRSATA